MVVTNCVTHDVRVDILQYLLLLTVQAGLKASDCWVRGLICALDGWNLDWHERIPAIAVHVGAALEAPHRI